MTCINLGRSDFPMTYVRSTFRWPAPLILFGTIAFLTFPTVTGAADRITRAPISHTSYLDEFDDLLKAALDLYNQKKYDEALAKCAKASELRPTDNRPHAMAGFVYMAQWKMKGASEAFAKAISLAPGSPKLHYAKATADRFRNAKDEALVSVRKAIELNPSYAEAYLLLGELLGIGDGDKKGQIEAFRKAIQLKPDLVDAYRSLGNTLEWVNKDDKGAEEVYRTAMQVDPKKMAGRFELGRLLVRRSRLKEARALWEGRTADEDKTFPNFITLLERAEKMERAKADLAQKPNDPDTLLQMGLIVMDGESWVVDGRQERAIEYFRKALQIRPRFAQAQFAIVKAYIEIADMDKDKSKNVDQELLKLRKLDAKLANEADDYRKNYSGGIKGTSAPIDQ